MRDVGLFIAAIGAILVSICSSNSQGFDGSANDEPLRMASDSLVVNTYKDAQSTMVSPTGKNDESEEIQIYQGVMGRPGIDFPVYSHIPLTTFSCRNVKKSGYYADLATDCQVFHVCDRNRKISFLCPNGTIFRQSHLICDWWFRVDCEKSLELYDESAEQLAADQKIYRARSEEREKRRKSGKNGSGEGTGELTSAEVLGLGETLKTNYESQRNRYVPSTLIKFSSPRPQPRKPERNSKKVSDLSTGGSSASSRRGKQPAEVAEESSEVSGSTTQFSANKLTNKEAKTGFAAAKAIFGNHGAYKDTHTSNGFLNIKESIYGAESGSLVEDLHNRTRDYVYGGATGDKTNYKQRNNNLNYDGSKIIKSQQSSNNNYKNLYFGSDEKRLSPLKNSNQNFQTTASAAIFDDQSNDDGDYINVEHQNINFAFDGRANDRGSELNSFSVGANFRVGGGTPAATTTTTTTTTTGFAYTSTPGTLLNSGNAYQGEQSQEAGRLYVSQGTTGFSSEGYMVNQNYNEDKEESPVSYQYSTHKPIMASGVDFNKNENAVYDNFAYSNPETAAGANGDFGYSNYETSNQNVDISENRNINFAKNQQTFHSTNSLTNGKPNSGYSTASVIAQHYTVVPDFVSSSTPRPLKNQETGDPNFPFYTTSRNVEQYEAGNLQSNINFGSYQNVESYSSVANNFTLKKEEYVERNKKGTIGDDDAIVRTTEYSNYESKRTNPIIRYETVTAPARPNQPLVYTSTPLQDKEKQFLAESAAFGHNQQSESYSNFRSHFSSVTPPKDAHHTVYGSPRPTYFTTGNPHSQQYSNGAETTTYRPVKQNSKKVTFLSNGQTEAFSNGFHPTTPFPQAPPGQGRTADDVYFTTSAPEGDTEQSTEFGARITTMKPDIDLSLQELNINKDGNQSNGQNKTYEDLVREGLEVPPSSGPNALRSFALYFATTNYTPENPATTYTPGTNGLHLAPTLSPVELKKKEIVKQVDELVQNTSPNTSEQNISSDDAKLPNSLTSHIQDTYLTLFPSSTPATVTEATTAAKTNAASTEFDFGTTNFEAFTEQPMRINEELAKNDLDQSQSRGLVEPEVQEDAGSTRVTADLRELAQVFTKALSAYLDDPEAFRKVLSEIRPTEPTVDSEASSSGPNEAITQEDDEVLDFSDVTKTYKKKPASTTIVRETTTEPRPDILGPNVNDVENFVVPLNHSSWATNIELTAPLLESLDQSQSSYYTPPPYSGTTNSIAEAINDFIVYDKPSFNEHNEDVDSYLPITSTDSSPKYGGFQNNTKKTTKYSPYGSELTSTTHGPIEARTDSVTLLEAAATSVTENTAATIFQGNSSSFFSHFTLNQTKEQEIQLAKELNNLVLLQKFTTPRGTPSEGTTTPSKLSTSQLSHQNDVEVDNGEFIQKNAGDRAGKSLHFPEAHVESNNFHSESKGIEPEIGPPSTTPKGFLITYSLGDTNDVTHPPTAIDPDAPTTYKPDKDKVTSFQFASETITVPATEYEPSRSYHSSPPESATQLVEDRKSIDRIIKLQETLMFNTNRPSAHQKEAVAAMMNDLNMTDTTADALIKMMEMAAKNETYKRLVLLLVNDKSGKNKTLQESRLSLLKALLTPVIDSRQARTLVPITDTSKLIPHDASFRIDSVRRSKSIKSESPVNSPSLPPPTPPPPVTTADTSKNSIGTRTKLTRGPPKQESNRKKPDLGNLGVLRRTIENSKSKQIRINSLDDAILDSDSRAVELLRSLYSLAARWG